MEIFAKRLKWMREQNRYSQKEVAEKLGMSLSGYVKIEYNQRDPKLETLLEICQIYNESVDFFLGVSDYTKELKVIDHRLEFLSTLKKDREQHLINLLMIQEGRKSKLSGMSENDQHIYAIELDDSIEKTKRTIKEHEIELRNFIGLLVDSLLPIPNVKLHKNKWIKELQPITIKKTYSEQGKVWLIQLYDKDKNKLGSSLNIKDDFDAELTEEEISEDLNS